MSWSGLDQRVFPRVNTQCNIAIHDGQFAQGIKARTQNIGVGGVCVILDYSLEKLSQVKLQLSLPKSHKTIECDGRIVWMVRSKEPASGKVTFDAGIEFVNLPAEDKTKIEQFIQTAA